MTHLLDLKTAKGFKMMEISKKEYDEFLEMHRRGKPLAFRGTRLGQAFYTHFQLDKMPDQSKAMKIFHLHCDSAKMMIEETFTFV